MRQSKWFSVKAKKRASIAATNRANRRWQIDRERRDKLASIDPVRVGGKIVERWVRIIGESAVRERTIYEFDRPCDVRRKRRELFA